ncbi:MAG: MmcQ/YjbR family DNA-binding protein [Bryobacteraceae bacterium]
MSESPPKALLEFLKPYDRATRELALAVRAVVLEELAPCCENIYDAYNAVAIGYGPTVRLKDGICHVAVYSRHVNLGFNRGAEMVDPDGLLQGSGKRARHIAIRTRADLDRPAIRKYLRRARKMAGARNLPVDFRRIALSLPEAVEGAHMGHADFRVGGKIFATLGYEKEGYGVLLVTPDEQAGMCADEPEIFSPVPGGWGRQGSTRVRLDKVTAGMLEGALRSAWRRRAPKRLLAGAAR